MHLTRRRALPTRGLLGASALLLLLALGTAGCREDAAPTASPARPSASADGAASTRTSAPTARASVVAAIPDDFPLAGGLVADGDTQVSAPARDVQGIDLTPVCGFSSWPGRARDRLVVTQVGPELGKVRELATYRSPVAARNVVSRIADAVASCPRQAGTSPEEALDLTLLDAGGPVFAETLPGGRPGGAVLAFVRVGRAVLGVEDGGEWTPESIRAGARRLRREDRDLVAAMCVFRAGGC